jgi:hypothetical protein
MSGNQPTAQANPPQEATASGERMKGRRILSDEGEDLTAGEMKKCRW